MLLWGGRGKIWGPHFARTPHQQILRSHLRERLFRYATSIRGVVDKQLDWNKLGAKAYGSNPVKRFFCDDIKIVASKGPWFEPCQAHFCGDVKTAAFKGPWFELRGVANFADAGRHEKKRRRPHERRRRTMSNAKKRRPSPHAQDSRCPARPPSYHHQMGYEVYCTLSVQTMT